MPAKRRPHVASWALFHMFHTVGNVRGLGTYSLNFPAFFFEKLILNSYIFQICTPIHTELILLRAYLRFWITYTAFKIYCVTTLLGAGH